MAGLLVACGFCSEEKNATQNGTTASVKKIGGVPRILVNGEAVRSRMLYVSPTYFTPSGPAPTDLKGNIVDVSFDTPKLKRNVSNGVLHFKGGYDPQKYVVGNFKIKEKDGGKTVYAIKCDAPELDENIAFWCKGKERKAALPLKISNFKSEEFPQSAFAVEIAKKSPQMSGFHVYLKNIKLDAGKAYTVSMKLKGSQGDKPLTFSYTLYDKRDSQYEAIAPLGESNVEPQVKLAADANVDIVTFPVQAKEFYLEGDMKPDYSYLDGALQSIVDNNPNAKILVRIRFYPPAWWMNKNPDHVLTFSNGQKSPLFPSISSQKFRSESQQVLRYIIGYAEKKFGKNIIGYHPGGGNSCEWFYGDSWRPLWSGYDKSTLEAWRKWLLKKYKTDAALQAAWGNPNAVLADASVPTKAERDAPDILINPQTQRKIVDFNTFQQDEMVDMIASLAKVIRQEVPDKLCVFFYGYAGEFSGMHNGPSQSGHYALGKLLKNKDIDALCGPISYYDRNIGDGKTTMGATESIMRNGMLWIDEDDTSTYLAPKNLAVPGFEKGQDTREKTLDVLTRNMSHEAVRNIGSWWMDLTGGGWFKDAELWKLKTLFKNIEEDFIKNPSPYNPPVALILDEPSVWHVGGKGASALSTRVFGTARKQLNRSAVPFGHYLLDDFLFGKPVKSKLDVYAVAYALDAKKRKAIRTRAKNKAAIYGWATGYIDTDKNRFSPEAMEETTGFKMEKNAKPTNGIAIPTSAGKSIGLSEKFGIDRELRPALYPVLEDGDIVFATYPNGKPAVVLRGKRLYCGVSHIPAEIYRHMAKLAGIHIYADTPAAVYANGAYIHITPADIPEGETRIVNVDTNSDKPVFDALSGKKLSDGSKISFKMKKGQSKILRLGDGNTDFAK